MMPTLILTPPAIPINYDKKLYPTGRSIFKYENTNKKYLYIIVYKY